MACKKPTVSRWVCPDSEGAMLLCEGNQTEFTRNPLWRWSPVLTAIRWCSGITPWPWLVPYQHLGASIMHLSGASKPEWDCPGDLGPGPRHNNVGREVPRGRCGRSPCCHAPQKAWGGGWSISAIWRPPSGLSPAGAADWGRTGAGGRVGQAGGYVRWRLAVPAPRRWQGNCHHPLQCPLDAQELLFL